MFGDDVKPKRKIPDMSLINFWETGTKIILPKNIKQCY